MTIEEIEAEVRAKKEEERTNGDKLPQVQEKPQSPTAKDTNVMELVKSQEGELLKTEELQRIGRKWGEERIKADLAEEASRIRQKNIETAKNEFKNETEELRLKHLKAELQLEHKYHMDTLEKDAKHKQMLSKRKKLVEKYKYLYNCSPENCYTCYDEEGQEYLVPKDFSYSSFVNRIRQFGRNVSKLDKPILQSIKWLLIIGGVIGGYFILKSIGVF